MLKHYYYIADHCKAMLLLILYYVYMQMFIITRESKCDVIAIWVVRLNNVHHSINRSVFTHKYVFYESVTLTFPL